MVRQTERVAVTEKNPFNAAVLCSRPVEVLQHLVYIPYAELLLLIHIAERTLVMCTANGDLHQQAVSLAGRPINISYISHSISPLIVIILVLHRLRYHFRAQSRK